MKITISINIGGYPFNIDEDAYGELKRYLKSLELHFAREESTSEILSDIEARIAELFRVKLTAFKQVITLGDVLEVISVLGSPEDISDGDTDSPGARSARPGYHRMYRDPDRRIIGGVCSGIGAYWNIEPLIVRVIFLALVLAGGLGVLIYLILYIVLPEAKTTSQKIEMKGETVNIENIKEAVKNEFETVKNKMNL